jgi:cytochrome c oxidase cbb3-type subunit 1
VGTVGIVATCLVLFHTAIVTLNLRGAIGGGGTALKFISFGLIAYVLGGLADAITSFRAVAMVTQFTHFAAAQQQLALYGAISMILFGGIYFAVPRLTGRAWPSGAFVSGHRIAVTLGVLLLVISLAMAGWTQGHDLNNKTVSFADLAAHTRPWLLAATAAQVLLLAGNLLLFVNLLRACLACCCPSNQPAENPFRPAATMEAHAS